jgi:hypothetical protein
MNHRITKMKKKLFKSYKSTNFSVTYLIADRHEIVNYLLTLFENINGITLQFTPYTDDSYV